MAGDFYARVLERARIAASESILAVCAGSYDKDTLLAAGFTDVVISNVDYHAGITDYSPYQWHYQDAENLSAKDGSFHWCVVHAGLHHCGSPHRTLCEMLRVARKGVIFIEARDSLLLRMAVKCGLTSDFELEPALLSNGKLGGFRNTLIPNFIYRWTEREVWKTVSSAEPQREPKIEFVYGYRIPTRRMAMSKSAVKRALTYWAEAAACLLQMLAPRQGNLFGVIIRKDGPLKPWLTESGGELAVGLDYIRKSYSPEKYKRGE